MKKFIQNQSSIKPKICNHLMIGCSAIIGIFFLDQVTKFIAVSLLPFGQAIEIIPILSFILVYNTGVSFSLFSGTSIFILIPVSLTVIFIVAWMWLKTSNSQSAVFGYGMIIGGAFGNLVDRIYRDGVVDFIFISYLDHGHLQYLTLQIQQFRLGLYYFCLIRFVHKMVKIKI